MTGNKRIAAQVALFIGAFILGWFTVKWTLPLFMPAVASGAEGAADDSSGGGSGGSGGSSGGGDMLPLTPIAVIPSTSQAILEHRLQTIANLQNVRDAAVAIAPRPLLQRTLTIGPGGTRIYTAPVNTNTGTSTGAGAGTSVAHPTGLMIGSTQVQTQLTGGATVGNRFNRNARRAPSNIRVNAGNGFSSNVQQGQVQQGPQHNVTL